MREKQVQKFLNALINMFFIIHMEFKDTGYQLDSLEKSKDLTGTESR